MFPAAGHDQWVAIVAQSDEAWQALAELIGTPGDAGLDLSGRLAASARLEAAVAAWTAEQAVDEIEAACQARGIAAHRVQNSPELTADPQLAHRRHWLQVEHTQHGPTWVEAPRFHLSRSPIGPRRGSPMLGEHTFEILTDLLGYDSDRIADLAAAEAFD